MTELLDLSGAPSSQPLANSAVYTALSMLLTEAKNLGEAGSIILIERITGLIDNLDKTELAPDMREELQGQFLQLLVDFQYQDRLSQTLDLVIKHLNELSRANLVFSNVAMSEAQVSASPAADYDKMLKHIIKGANGIQPALNIDLEQLVTHTDSSNSAK